MADIFNIGLTGLHAASTSLSTVSHNIANANSTGYTRQIVQQSAFVPQNLGSLFVGAGVSVDAISRSYSKYLTDQVFTAQSSYSYYSSQQQQLSQIDNIMTDRTAGLTPDLQAYFTSLQTLSSDPASLPSRQNVLSSAQALAAKFQSINNRLTEIQNGTNTQIVGAVNQINSIASKIANLNQQIATMAPVGSSNQPNDLLDQRDQAVQDLNKLIKASYVVQSDGSYAVFIGNGQSLVLGNMTLQLGTQVNATNPVNVDITQTSQNGAVTIMSPSLFTGGSLGGLINFRDGTLLQTQQNLGNIAIDLSTTMNYQQTLGLDRNGNAGSVIFADLTSYAGSPQNAAGNFRVLMGDPSNIAAASNMQAGAVTPATSNLVVTSVSPTLPGSYGWTSTATPPLASNHPSVSASIVVTAITSTSISATITGGSAPGTYNVVTDPFRQNGYKLMSNAIPAVDLGIAFSLSGQLQAGASFTITANTATSFGTGDNSNLLQMVSQQTKALVDSQRNGSLSGLQSYQDAYASATSVVGNAAATTKSYQATANTNLQQTTTTRSNFSGVNLDQEAADLLRYQQAYQASSKVISVAQTLFQQILQLN